jgi:hypothetical protein
MTVLSSWPPAASAGFLSKRIIDMPSAISHLENIDPRFLDPDVSLVVMHQDVENSLNEAYLALDGIVALMDSAANMNAAAASVSKFLEVPPDSFAALMRLVCDRIKPAINNPTLGAVQSLRPDLFETATQGV